MNGDRGKIVETLLEAAASAYRESDATGRVLPSGAWLDLSAEDREWLFDLQMESRLVERAMDPRSLSGTGRSVMEKIRGLEQMG